MTRSCVSKNRILICAVFALLFSNSAFCCTTGVEHQVVLKKMDKMLYNAFSAGYGPTIYTSRYPVRY